MTRLYQNSSMLHGGPVQSFVDNAIAQSGVLSLNDSEVNVATSSTLESGNTTVKDNIDEYLSDRKLFSWRRLLCDTLRIFFENILWRS